jgi:hypothetical protein
MVEGIGDVEVTESIDCDAPRGVEESGGSGAAIAAIAGGSDALRVFESDNRVDGAGSRGDLANDVVDAVGDVEVSGTVQGNAGVLSVALAARPPSPV